MNQSAFTRPACASDVDGMAVLGMTRHALMGIRYEDGTGGAAPAAPAPSPTGAALGAATPPAPAQTATPPAPTATGTPAAPQIAAQPSEVPPAINKLTGQPYTPAETATYIATLRQEAKDNREKATTAEKLATAESSKLGAVLAALGLNADGTTAAKTPEQLTAELNDRTSAVETTQRENLLLRVAPSLGANADKLLDSRTFTTKLSSIAVDDKAGVEALVKETIENDPTYKLAPPPAASSGGTSHAGGVPTAQRKTLSEALDEKLPKGNLSTQRK